MGHSGETQSRRRPTNATGTPGTTNSGCCGERQPASCPPPHPRASPGAQRPRVQAGTWAPGTLPPRGRLCARPHPARDTSGCAPATGAGLPPPRPPSRAQAGLVPTATWTPPRAAPREQQPSWGQGHGHGHAPRGGRGGARSRPHPAASPQPPAPGRGAGAGTRVSPDPPGPAEATRGLPPASQGRAVRADQGGTRATVAPAPP